MAVLNWNGNIKPMIIDGKKIAEKIFSALKKDIVGKTVTLSVFIVGNNSATESFIRIKRRKADEVGIKLKEIRFDKNVEETHLIKSIKEEGKKRHTIVVQLPLPATMDRDRVLNSIPANLDVDVLSTESNLLFEKGELPILPPVVGAIDEILKKENVDVKGKKVVVLGLGALVGKPSVIWFKYQKGAEVIALDSKIEDTEIHTREADIIVSGVGIPNLITPDMIKDGVVLLDAGTSEEGGELKGDISLECAKKASIFTPVPGGIGPITVAVLFRNVIMESSF